MQQHIPQPGALVAHTLLAVAALLLAACASDPVTSNLDPNANLEKYQTYAFLADLATDGAESYGSLETTYLKNAVARELQAGSIILGDTK